VKRKRRRKIEFDKNFCGVEYVEDDGLHGSGQLVCFKELDQNFCEKVKRKRRRKIEFDKNFCGVEYVEDDGLHGSGQLVC
jgi:hypothetical protein